jgi:hypothetical protein
MTTGYGLYYRNADDISNPNFWYTDSFNGTSSASPIVAGSVANLQGIALNRSGSPISPNQVRTILVSTGSPQLGDTSQNIGPRPNLSLAIAQIPTNNPPTADANGPYTVGEGETVTLDASDSFDLDGTILSYEWDLDNDGSYDDAIGVTTVTTFGDDGTFTVGLQVTNDAGASDTTTAVVSVLNLDPSVSAAPTNQSLQYSDQISNVTITASDVAADTLSLTAIAWQVDGGGFNAGLPNGLALTASGCTNYCTWTLSGVAGVATGVYTVRLTVEDEDGGISTVDATITVLPEDATISFGDGNPVSVRVDEPGGNSGLYSLTIHLSETQPDQLTGSSAPGDISNAVGSISLVPVGPGGPVVGACAPVGLTGSGYDAVLTITCNFDNVPVNTYSVQVTVAGGYYAGSNEDVLVVYDPSLGFTTGGGWFYWPDTEEKTNFGYTMKYNKKGKKVVGSLLLIRHLDDGSIYRVKSNALYGLALGEVSSGPFGWASFSGKSTYSEPGWPEPEGNYEFVVYVQDHDEPGTGVDQFWVEVHDKDRGLIQVMSMDRQAGDNLVELMGGNIVVPHQGK